MQLDFHSQAIPSSSIVSSSGTASCDAQHHDSLPLSGQNPRQVVAALYGKEPSTPNLRRSTGPLTRQTFPPTTPNITSFNRAIPLILIPDLTRLITRPYPCYSVSGGAYGEIYKCVYHSQDGDIEVRANCTGLPCFLLMCHAPAGRCESNSTTIH